MRKFAVAIILLTALGGCATSPIPEGYTGPLASISDSATPRSSTSIDFFMLSKVNGRIIHDSVAGTSSANYGRGFAMTPVVVKRDVPAQPATFTISGRTHYAAPILALTGKVYAISGDIEFTPEPNGRYVVKGEMSDRHSVVWLEDAATGAVIGRKIETEGKSTLGILEK